MRLTVISTKKRGNAMRKVILVLVEIGLLIGAGVLLGQEKQTYQPNETQSLRLQLRQKDAVIAQKDLQVAQQRFQGALNDLNAEADKVKAENHWSKEVTFAPDTLTFSVPQLPPPIKDKKP
jgi:hypothetical protein